MMSEQWTIWKYQIPTNQNAGLGNDDTFTLSMPYTAVPFSVGCQHGSAVLWAMVDTESELPTKHEPRQFLLCGTGLLMQQHPKSLKPLGTIMLHGGSLVLHVFEITK